MNKKEIKKHIENDLDCSLKTTETIINCASQLLDMKFNSKINISKRDINEIKEMLNNACARLDILNNNYKLIKK